MCESYLFSVTHGPYLVCRFGTEATPTPQFFADNRNDPLLRVRARQEKYHAMHEVYI
jgi:hypothetical protein